MGNHSVYGNMAPFLGVIGFSVLGHYRDIGPNGGESNGKNMENGMEPTTGCRVQGLEAEGLGFNIEALGRVIQQLKGTHLAKCFGCLGLAMTYFARQDSCSNHKLYAPLR